MFAKPKVSKGDIIISILLGIGASLISLFLLLKGMDIVDPESELLPVNDVRSESVVYYATQHGAFSSKEAAEQFQKQYPTLNKSIVIDVDGSYLIWSKLHVSKTTEETTPSSFSKQVNLSGEGCSDPTIAGLPKLLQDDKWLKNNLDAKSVPADWDATFKAISGISTDIAEVRLLLLDHYRQQQTCLKVSFDSWF